MKKRTLPRIILVGLLAGFVGNAILGLLFTSSIVKSILYNPSLQSKLFIEVTPLRNVPLSVVGLIVLSIIHAWLYFIFKTSIPGKTWIKKGLFWGFTIWSMYWLFQEWFIYHTLLGEPILLNLLELVLLLLGSLAEGVIIAYFLVKKSND